MSKLYKHVLIYCPRQRRKRKKPDKENMYFLKLFAITYYYLLYYYLLLILLIVLISIFESFLIHTPCQQVAAMRQTLRVTLNKISRRRKKTRGSAHAYRNSTNHDHIPRVSLQTSKRSVASSWICTFSMKV